MDIPDWQKLIGNVKEMSELRSMRERKREVKLSTMMGVEEKSKRTRREKRRKGR